MKRRMSMLRLLLIEVALFLPPVAFAGASLEYRPFRSATYAVFTKYRVGNQEIARDGQRETRVLRLDFERHVTEEGFEADEYKMHVLNLDTEQPDFSHTKTVYLTKQGRIPVYLEGFRRGHVGSLLSPHGIPEHPLLFPVLPATSEQVKVGVSWISSMPPLLVDDSLIMKAISGEMDISMLSPVQVETCWETMKKVQGRQCAKLVSSFSVRDEVRNTSASFTITSYFSPEIGLPVVVVAEGKGHIVSDTGKLDAFDFFRKEILVSYEGIPAQHLESPKELKTTPNNSR